MKVAAVQTDVLAGNSAFNVGKVMAHLKNLKSHGVDLVVFPEAALTGYCFDSLAESLHYAIDVSTPGPIHELARACDFHQIGLMIGFAEKRDGLLLNTAALFEPGQPVRFYRKTHLPYLGMDRFATPGDELVVWETRYGRIGPLICYDLRPPEAARTLTLKGADMILLPTNWPEGAESSADHVAIARAVENRVFVITCNRVGTENGFRFIGKSKIIHASGRLLAAGEALEVVLVADLEPAEAREKRVVLIPEKYEVDVINCRRADIYRV